MKVWTYIAGCTLILFLVVTYLGLKDSEYEKVLIGLIGVIISLYGMIQPVKPCPVCSGFGYVNSMKCPNCKGKGCI